MFPTAPVTFYIPVMTAVNKSSINRLQHLISVFVFYKNDPRSGIVLHLCETN